MIVADWIFLGMILVGLGLGALAGFGRIFKFFTTGIFGIIISVVVCFLIGAAFYGPFEPLLNKLADTIAANENWFCQFLAKINIQTVLYYVIMFVAVWLLRFIVVKIIKAISEVDNVVIKIINRSLGAVMLLAILFMLGFLAFFVIGWVGGPTADEFYAYLSTGKLGLGAIFRFINPVQTEAAAFVLGLI